MFKNIIFRIILIFIGILLVVIPNIYSLIKDIRGTSDIYKYQCRIEELDDTNIKEEYNYFKNYNENVKNKFEADVSIKNYLSTNNNYVLGYIEIPKIKIFLPIYEGCSKSNLDLGVGHIENTSMPIGGIGTHCVLAGHTGIRRTKIFDDIHELRNGDNFFINILNLKLEYEVDNIKVVNPDDSKAIQIDNENDFVTLVTCTPKGENSKRLLVRGRRKKIDEQNQIDIGQTVINNEKNKSLKIIRKNEFIIVVIALSGAILAMILITIIIKRYNRNNQKKIIKES